ncbi:MAG: HD domain-containing protein [Planctomycetaceae bacterium]
MFQITDVDDILRVFHERGNRHYGEEVSELQHALQAAEFAGQFGEPEGVVLSCLLHDFGHMLHDLGEEIAGQGVDARHEELGATLLESHFPKEIVDPIRLHVAAKRYLCWQDPGYSEGLSPSSKLSLNLQGGPMSNLEATEFERLPHYQQAVRVRRYDDMAKVPEMQTADLSHYRALIAKYMR